MALAILRASIEIGEGSFEFNPPPYEYNHEVTPIKLILGRMDVEQKLTANSFDLTEPYWHDGCESYIESVADCLMYARNMRVF